MLSPAQRLALVEMSTLKRRTCWTRRYEWWRGRVVLEEQTGESFERSDGRLVWMSLMTTGKAFAVWIPVWWWQRWRYRKEIPLNKRKALPLPEARLLR